MLHTFTLFLLSFGMVQGALLAVALLRKTRQVETKLIVSLLMVISLQLAFKVIAKSWLWEHAHIMYMWSYNLPLLVGPLLYLLVRTRLRPVDFTPKDLLHFLPFFLQMTNTTLDVLFGRGFLPTFWWTLFPWPALDLFSLWVYGTVAWRQVERANNQAIKKRWRPFLALIVAAETVIIITIALLVWNHPHFPDVRWLFIVLTIVIYWISYQLIAEPADFFASAGPAASEPALKYANSGLTPDEAERIAGRLEEAMRQERLFLDPELSLQTLADRLDVRRHDLSQVINERFGMTYTELVYQQRLAEARARLTDPRYRRLTIAAIALDSGFNSVSSFTTMFKRRFKLTPSAYRKQHVS